MSYFFRVFLITGLAYGLLVGGADALLGVPLPLYRYVVGGVIFGLLMGAWFTWYVGRHRRRLEARGIDAKDLRPRQTREFTMAMPPAQALDACRRAVESLPKVRVRQVDAEAGTLVARTGMTMRSFGERVTIQISPAGEGSLVRLSSEPRVMFTLIDYGKGVENVESIRLSLVSGTG